MVDFDGKLVGKYIYIYKFHGSYGKESDALTAPQTHEDTLACQASLSKQQRGKWFRHSRFEQNENGGRKSWMKGLLSPIPSMGAGIFTYMNG